MKMTIFKFKTNLLYIAVTLFSMVNIVSAGEFHSLNAEIMTCADCHTMHYMDGGVLPTKSEAGGPWDQLLLVSTTTKLCLMCHDGSDVKAPDVLHPVNMYDNSGDEHSGAGSFYNSEWENTNGHDLENSVSDVPFSTLTNITMNCASCHDPHGTDNYRNLLTKPIDARVGTTVVILDTDIFENINPPFPPDQSGAISAYRESNTGYKANMSLWCMNCHDDLKNNMPGAGRIHHLTDVPLNGTGYNTDPAHWAAGSGSGFGDATGDLIEGVPRLRFQSADAYDYSSSKSAGQDNQVYCGTCHLAHGGGYRYGLAWPYADTGGSVDKDSGCQQCHNL